MSGRAGSRTRAQGASESVSWPQCRPVVPSLLGCWLGWGGKGPAACPGRGGLYDQGHGRVQGSLLWPWRSRRLLSRDLALAGLMVHGWGLRGRAEVG